eukprot:1157514-Pelagomonas_calceolata.AAC.5
MVFQFRPGARKYLPEEGHALCLSECTAPTLLHGACTHTMLTKKSCKAEHGSAFFSRSNENATTAASFCAHRTAHYLTACQTWVGCKCRRLSMENKSCNRLWKCKQSCIAQFTCFLILRNLVNAHIPNPVHGMPPASTPLTWSWTPCTARPEGSSLPSHAASHAAAVAVEQATLRVCVCVCVCVCVRVRACACARALTCTWTSEGTSLAPLLLLL